MPPPGIRLLPLQIDQAAIFHRWIQDPEVTVYSLNAFQQMDSLAKVSQWLEATLADTRSLNLGVYLAETQELIGHAGISGMSAVNRQVLARGFAELGLNRIMLTVSEPNQGGVKAYERAGFRREGRLRQACFRNGAFHDKLMMSVLREEWSER